MEKIVTANGINTEQKKIMDNAKTALKIKSLNSWESKKTHTSIYYLNVKGFANKRI